MKNKLHLSWLVGGFVTLFAAIILFVLSQTVLNDFTTVNKQIDTYSEAYLSFNTNYAKIDSPLTVSIHNLDYDPDKIVYTWIVGSKIIENNHSDTYTPVQEDLEKFITVEISYDFDKTLTASLYCSKLPVIYVNTDNGLGVGDDYSKAFVAMQSSPGFTDDNSELYFGEAYLKLRGNSTRNRLKKPYKLMFEEPCNLFGMGSSRHWVLIANDIDHTLIRNKLVYDFSGSLGMPYAAESINVVLIFNNEYQGVYQLCEQVRISDERVDIFDWENLADEAAELIIAVKKETLALNNETADSMRDELAAALITDLSWITAPFEFTYNNETYIMTDYVDIPDISGGFLLEMDFYHLNEPAISQITTNYSQPFFFSSPEYAVTNSSLYEYADKYIQTFEYALHSNDFFYHDDEQHYSGSGQYYDWNTGWVGTETPVTYSDPEHDNMHYSQLFNMDSLVNNWLICEFTMNWDSMKNSVFISKDIGKPAEISPVWDFDWAFGNINMYNIDTWFPECWHTTNEYFTIEQYYQSVQWNRYLIKDPYFLLKVYEKYKSIRPTLIEDIIRDGGTLDRYYEDLKEAGNANDNKWMLTYVSYNSVGFELSMKNLRQFIETRIAWLDKQFKDFDTFVNSLGCYTSSENITVDDLNFNSDGTVTITVSVNDSTADSVAFQINGTSVYYSTVINGTAEITTKKLYSSGSNIVVVHGIDSDGSQIDGLSSYLVFGGE